MEMALSRLRPMEPAVVTRVEVPPELRKRLEDYGLVPGTQVICRYRSPRQDVTALEFRGATIALRTRDLQMIRVCVR